MLLARALHLHRRWRPSWPTRAGPEGQRGERVPHLLNLHDVYRALLARGQRRAMDFETTETQIVCDENGRIEKIVPRTRNDAHRLIEEAMLAANVCSADFIQRAKHPRAVPRTRADAEKRIPAAELPEGARPGLSVSDDLHAREFQPSQRPRRTGPTRSRSTDAAALDAAGDHTGTNAGHFGLAFEASRISPARSGAILDLLVHRVIKALGHRQAITTC